MSNEKVDILIIGAGPSGTVAASMVHKSGLKTKIVEKQQFPRFVIGESLIPRCMEHFEEAGFMEVLKAQGYQEKHGAKFLRDDRVCHFKFAERYTKEAWTWTWQVPRADFDKTLADEVERRGVPIDYQTAVTNIEFNGTDSITTVVDKDGNESTIEAKFIIDASGWGRVIPRMFNLDKPSNFPARKAMFSHAKDPGRPTGEGGQEITFVVIEQDVWMWIIPFSNGNTSLGFVGNTEFFDRFTGTPEENFRAMLKLDPHHGERFHDPKFIFEPKAIMGYASSVEKTYGEGFALTGNAAEFLDPVFSSGVTFGAESGLIAGKLASRQIQGETIDWETDFHQHVKKGVDTFRSYVTGWYDSTLQDIFFTNLSNVGHKEKICSVLAGYVWDRSNPFVKKHNRAIKALSQVIRMREEAEGV